MEYDYLIKNGWHIEFETMSVSKKDLAVRNGKIIKTADHIEASAAEVIDAEGKYVLPGLIDEHTHLNYMGNAMGANADLLCIPSGITTAVDAGTAGWSNFPMFYQNNILRYTTSVKAYLHLAPYGMMCGVLHEENHDPGDFNEQKILEAFEKYPDVLKGVKLRLCRTTVSDYGIEPLKRALEISATVKEHGYSCRVAVHVADLPVKVKIEEILELLGPGDLFVHVFQPVGETVFDEQGKIRPCVWEARSRGVLFDCSNGRPHWTFQTLRQAVEDGFYPDIISSDVIRLSQFRSPGFSLLHAMAVCSAAGWEVKEILKRVTYQPAKILGILDEAGTLGEGRNADLCIMDITRTGQQLRDAYGNLEKSNCMFVPLLTMKAGEIVFRQIYFA